MTRHPRLFVCLVALVAVVAAELGVRAQTSGAARLRQEKIRDAAVRSVEESLGSLGRVASPTVRLASIMLEGGARHRVPTESRQLLLASETDGLRAAVRTQLERFARGQTELPANWVDTVLASERSRIDASIAAVLQAGFEARFVEARQRAVETQNATLSRVLAPSQADVEYVGGEAIASLTQDSLDVLVAQRGGPVVQRYVAQALKGRTVFEENRASVGQEAGGLLRRGLQDLWSQTQYVARHDGAGAIDASAIQAIILDGVGRIAGGQIFPSVRRAIPERAAALERTLFLAYAGQRLMTQNSECVLVQPQAASLLPSSYRNAPAGANAHVQAIVEQLLPHVRSDLLSGYLDQVKDPTARPPLSRRLVPLLVSAELDLASLLTTCVRNAVRRHRIALADQELTDVLPEIATMRFEVSNDGLRILHEGRRQDPDAVGPPLLRPLRLEETAALRRDRAGQILSEAKQVIDTQMALVHDGARKARFRQLIAADTVTPEETFRARYAAEVLDAWLQADDRVLIQRDSRTLHPDKYQRLADLAAASIEEVISFEFRQRQAVAASMSPTAPADGSESGGGRGNGPGSGSGSGDGGGGGAGSGGGGGGGPCPSAAPLDPSPWRSLVLPLALAFIAGALVGRILRSRSRPLPA